MTMSKATYKPEDFRTVKHGLDDAHAYCRMCDWSEHGKDAGKKGRLHAKKTNHTVDTYTERWTEYTSHRPTDYHD